MINRRELMAVSCIGAFAAAEACIRGASAQSKAQLRLQLSWIPNVEYSALWLALNNGYFDQKSLNVHWSPGGPNAPSPLVMLAAGKAEIGYTSWLPFLDGVSRGTDFVLIGATYKKSPLGILSLAKRPLLKPEDLVDARILTQGAVEKTSIDATLALAKLPNRWTSVPVGYSPEPLLAGAGDGYTGFGTNQVIILERMGLVRDKDFFFRSFDDFGFSLMGGLLATRRSIIERDRMSIINFLSGIIRGLKDNAVDPKVAPKLVVEKYGKDLGLNLSQQTRQNELQLAFINETSAGHYLKFDPKIVAGPMLAAAHATGRDKIPAIESLVDFRIADEANVAIA